MHNPTHAYRVNDAVTVPLSDGSRVRGRILYVDDAPGPEGYCADVEVLDVNVAAPVIWARVDDLQPVVGAGRRCNYTPTRMCDCATECALHFGDSEGC